MNFSWIAIIIVIVALLAGGFIGWHGRRFIQRLETLEDISKRRKLPYPAMAGLEDAIALSDDARFENGSMDKVIEYLLMVLAKDVAARKYQDARFSQVEEILKQLRTDPQSYDTEKPSATTTKDINRK